MTDSRSNCTKAVQKKIKIDKKKNYKRIVFKESLDEEDHVVDEKYVTDKIKNRHFELSQNGSRRLSKENNYSKKLKDLCDSESDSDFDLRLPKLRKVEKSIEFSFIKQKSSFVIEEPLCENISLKNAHSANSVSSQQNIPKVSITRIQENNYEKKLKEFYDSESDSGDENWKLKNFWKRKLNFDSTAEIHLEDITLPKVIKKEKPVDLISTESKKSFPTEEQHIRKSFVASLSNDIPLKDADLKAIDYRVNYTSSREELCRVLYKLFNEKVFDNKLPINMAIEWSARLQASAGKFNYYKPSLRAQALGITTTTRSPKIVLAVKMLDSPNKLRDTLIHEMCHAASWLINKVNDGHGNIWKTWVSKAMKAFPELPAISRLCQYDVQTKYVYKCTNCGKSVGRHVRSIDLSRKRCRYCLGKFKLLINKV